ncbi:uncharacterized protein PG986_003616, partial [Apiospora aurea]
GLVLAIWIQFSEDEKLRASSIARRRGGNCPNTIEVLQQLVAQRAGAAELQANLVAVLPNRDTAAVKDIEAYIIRNTATSSRTIINYNALQEMTTAEFRDIADTLGTEAGRIPDVSLECMLYLRQQYPGIKISVELEKPAREGLQEWPFMLTLSSSLRVGLCRSVTSKLKQLQGNGYPNAINCMYAQAELAKRAWVFPPSTRYVVPLLNRFSDLYSAALGARMAHGRTSLSQA